LSDEPPGDLADRDIGIGTGFRSRKDLGNAFEQGTARVSGKFPILHFSVFRRPKGGAVDELVRIADLAIGDIELMQHRQTVEPVVKRFVFQAESGRTVSQERAG
jgi:hypothetical protein